MLRRILLSISPLLRSHHHSVLISRQERSPRWPWHRTTGFNSELNPTNTHARGRVWPYPTWSFSQHSSHYDIIPQKVPGHSLKCKIWGENGNWFQKRKLANSSWPQLFPLPVLPQLFRGGQFVHRLPVSCSLQLPSFHTGLWPLGFPTLVRKRTDPGAKGSQHHEAVSSDKTRKPD